MPWGSWINDLPTEFFLVVHITAFALGAGFAWLAFKRELALLGSAFELFAAAELVSFGGVPHLPSVVLASESGSLVVGFAAEQQVGVAPERAERTPKRRLGDAVMLLGSRAVRPVEAVANLTRQDREPRCGDFFGAEF